MAMYNSSVGLLNEDDSDITIINPSIIHEHNDEDVNNTQITNSQINNTSQSVNDNGGYIVIDYNPEQIEQALKLYIGDLKLEKNTQLDCDKQLVTRLLDRIRPVYLPNQEKMTQLDNIMKEIGLLHDKRHVEQEEKIQQLNTEIRQLNRLLISANNNHSLCSDPYDESCSRCSTMRQGHSINDYDQWTEIEDDAKKLHEIVQSQKNQINEIVTLISQTATASNSLETPIVPIIKPIEADTGKPITPPPSANLISTLLKKIHDITGTNQQESATTALPSDTTLINHSPGTSPTQSMATLISNTLTLSVNNTTEQIDNQPPIDDSTTQTDIQPPIHVPKTQIDNQPPIHDPKTQIDIQPQILDVPHVPIVIPVPPLLPVEPRRCPVCNHEFSATSEDVDMYDHIENCLFPTGKYTEPKDYTCPNCERKFPGNEEMAYHRHLADCYKDM